MSAKHVWQTIVSEYIVCRHRGHQWGERQWWGDAASERRGTHRCVRCGSIGYPIEHEETA